MRGTATPSAGGRHALLTSANDFADAIVTIKQALAKRSAELSAEADRLSLFAGESLAARVKQFRAEADALQQRVDQPKVEELLDNHMPSLLVAINGGLVKLSKLSDVSATGQALIPLKSMDEAKPGTWKLVTYETPEGNRKVSDQEIAFLEQLRPKVERSFNWRFLTAGDSRDPELAGIRGALVGTALTLSSRCCCAFLSASWRLSIWKNLRPRTASPT